MFRFVTYTFRFLLKMADKDESLQTCMLPLSRVKTIMKSSPDVSCISQEALFLAGKATELFIQSLAQVSLEKSTDKKSLQYRDLAEVVNSIDTLQFLQDIVPKKITAREFFEMLKQNEDEDEET